MTLTVTMAFLFFHFLPELNQYRTAKNCATLDGSAYDGNTWEMIKNGGPFLPQDLIYGKKICNTFFKLQNALLTSTTPFLHRIEFLPATITFT